MDTHSLPPPPHEVKAAPWLAVFHPGLRRWFVRRGPWYAKNDRGEWITFPIKQAACDYAKKLNREESEHARLDP
jgi:hypothetical protein